MNGVWRSLLWKEWREQRSSIAILTAFFVLIPSLFSLRTPTNYFGVYSMTLFVVPIMCLFVAMGIAAREQSSGTIGFLQALPISPRKPATAKLLWGIISVTAPLLIALGIAWLVRAALGSAAQEAINRDARTYESAGQAWFLVRAVIPPLAAVSLLLWFSATGVNGSDEVRAGAIGLLVVVLFWGTLFLAAYTLELLKVNGWEFLELGMAMAPGGIATANLRNLTLIHTGQLSAWDLLLALVMLASHIALAATYVGRLGRSAGGRRQTVEHVTVRELPTWLAPPRRSPFAAIVWKQFRESAPLAVMGAACIALITLIIYLSTRREAAGTMTANQLLFIAAAVWMTVGVMVAVVAGVGVFLDDLSPGLNGFWRSRPIQIGQWFMVKYVVGLLVTIVTLAIPLLAVALYVWVSPDGLSNLNDHDNLDARNFVAMGSFGQVAVYNCAIAAIVLLRRPIHAAFTAIVAALLTWLFPVLMTESLAVSVANQEIAILMFVGYAVVASFVITWLAVKNDWGWRR
jgi:ABC-type transport system involved in multi-copper enzyme maturation permease subunit